MMDVLFEIASIVIACFLMILLCFMGTALIFAVLMLIEDWRACH